jgi:Tfp pilus assembly protein PilO
MTKSLRRNSLIVTIPLVVVAVAWALLVFWPIQKAIGRVDTEAAEIRDFCNHSTQQLSVLRRTRQEVASARKRIAYWNETAPSRQDLAPLLGRITGAARGLGLRITRFDPEPIVAFERIARMPVSLGINGSFPDLYRFLEKLESLPQCIWIERVEFVKEEKDSKNVHCKVSMDVFMDNPKDSDQINNVNTR